MQIAPLPHSLLTNNRLLDPRLQSLQKYKKLLTFPVLGLTYSRIANTIWEAQQIETLASMHCLVVDERIKVNYRESAGGQRGRAHPVWTSRKISSSILGKESLVCQEESP